MEKNEKKCNNKLNILESKLTVLKSEGASSMVALQCAQSVIGYINGDVINMIAKIFGEKPEAIYSVASFYPLFKLQKEGKHIINVCTGTACFVLGAENILKEVEKLLGISDGETTPDGLFSLTTVHCVGCCANAPVMTIDGKVYAKVKAKNVESILSEWGYRQ